MWSFSTYGETVEIEESVFLAGSDGPRRTVQIVIYGHARQQADRALEPAPHAAGADACAPTGRRSRNCRCRPCAPDARDAGIRDAGSRNWIAAPELASSALRAAPAGAMLVDAQRCCHPAAYTFAPLLC